MLSPCDQTNPFAYNCNLKLEIVFMKHYAPNH